MTTVRKLNQT